MTTPTAPYVGPFSERMAAFFQENRIFLRHPFKVDGVYRDGDVITVDPHVRVERYATLPPRRFVSMGAYSYCISRDLPSGVRIGRYCSVAKNVLVLESTTADDSITTRAFPFGAAPQAYGDVEVEPVAPDVCPVLGDDVWIGQNVMLRRGVTIGTGAIVAAGSVVNEDVAPYTIVGGVNAKPIRLRFPEPLVERMLKVAWWRYNYADFGDLPMEQPEAFLDGLEAKIDAGEIATFEPGVVPLAAALADWMAEKAES